MELTNTVALVTGANRGIGRALTLALIEAGAAKVYAGARDPRLLEPLLPHGSGRIVPLQLDVTKPEQVARAAERAGDTKLLFNNAGVLSSGSFLQSSREQLEADLAINYFGTLEVTRAFVPVLERASGGAIVNVLTVVSLAAMPALGGYAASKAATWSMTQAFRGELAPRGIPVFAVFPGPIDTDMSRDIPLDKTSPEATARAIVAGVARDQLDIFPDPMSQAVGQTWATDPNELGRQFASFAL